MLSIACGSRLRRAGKLPNAGLVSCCIRVVHRFSPGVRWLQFLRIAGNSQTLCAGSPW